MLPIDWGIYRIFDVWMHDIEYIYLNVYIIILSVCVIGIAYVWCVCVCVNRLFVLKICFHLLFFLSLPHTKILSIEKTTKKKWWRRRLKSTVYHNIVSYATKLFSPRSMRTKSKDCFFSISLLGSSPIRLCHNPFPSLLNKYSIFLFLFSVYFFSFFLPSLFFFFF